MGKFIVELRSNKPNVTEADEPEAWLGTVGRKSTHPDYPDDVDEIPAPVGKREAATEFHNEREAKNVLNRLPDAFFDRYWSLTVEVADAPQT